MVAGCGIAAFMTGGLALAVCGGSVAAVSSQQQSLRLTKIHRLLARSGVVVPYSTLHRFAAQELGFGRKAATVPVADGEPGHELQVDTGWVLSLEPDGDGIGRRRKAFIFTPNVSRYRFVYPIEHETTARRERPPTSVMRVRHISHA